MRQRFQSKRSLPATLAIIATSLALIAVLLGAYTRLKDAGLGCPDWPGCYGQWQVPHTSDQLQRATIAYPKQQVEQSKAWPEMLHRYVAGTLATLTIVLAIAVYRRRSFSSRRLLSLALLIGLIVFQALLGMWTVTLLLYPPIVMGHLLAGMTLTAVLWWLTIRLNGYFSQVADPHLVRPIHHITLRRLRIAAGITLTILAIQIALGGWTSANYAGPSCPDFPACQGKWLPPMDLAKGFNWAMPIGNNFQGGLLDNAGRIAIHMMHRFGALITSIMVGGLALWLIVVAKNKTLRVLGVSIALLLLCQITVGISFVLLRFPLGLGVVHNGMAMLLLLSVVALNASLYQRLATVTLFIRD
jgi:cytochrome c oxidase assembly protein subunit 15